VAAVLNAAQSSPSKSVIAAIGKDSVDIRFSPYSTYLGMEIRDPLPQFVYIVSEVRRLGLAWLHVVEPRMDGIFDAVRAGTIRPLVEAWGHSAPLIVNGGYAADNVRQALEEEYRNFNVAVSFGRRFIANPDLVSRLKCGARLNAYNRATFYKAKAAEEYVDYPFEKP
jgi:NADPH2 dehydrogenase